MSEFQIIAHVQGNRHTVKVTPGLSGGYEISAPGTSESAKTFKHAVQAGIESARRFLQRNLTRQHDQAWGVRVVTRCGTFQFGDWSFEPLLGGGGFPSQEPILDLFREWEDRGNREPLAALAGARKLVEFCGEN